MHCWCATGRRSSRPRWARSCCCTPNGSSRRTDEAVESLKLRELSGTVRLGCNDEPQIDRIAEIIRTFKAEHPKVGVHTRIGLSSVVGAWLRAGELDLAVLQRLAEDIKENDTVLRQDRLAWFGSPDLELGKDGAVPLITFGPRGFYRPIAERVLRSAGHQCEVVVECESTSGVIAAVESGLGVAVLNAAHPVATRSRPVRRGARTSRRSSRGVPGRPSIPALTGPWSSGAAPGPCPAAVGPVR